MSSAAKSFRTRRMRPFSRQREGDVPMPQLYRDISEGYEYFLQRRMKAGTLGITVREMDSARPKMRKPSTKQKSRK